MNNGANIKNNMTTMKMSPSLYTTKIAISTRNMLVGLQIALVLVLLVGFTFMPSSASAVNVISSSKDDHDRPILRTIKNSGRILYADDFEPKISRNNESTIGSSSSNNIISSSLMAWKSNGTLKGSYTKDSGVVYDKKYCTSTSNEDDNNTYHCLKLSPSSIMAHDKHHHQHSLSSVAWVERSIDFTTLLKQYNSSSSSNKDQDNNKGIAMLLPSVKITFNYNVIRVVDHVNIIAAKVHFSNDNGMTWTKVATLPVGSNGTMEVDVENNMISSLFKMKVIAHHGTTLYVDNVIVKDTTIPLTKLDGTNSFIDHNNIGSSMGNNNSNETNTIFHWTDHWSSGPGVRTGINAAINVRMTDDDDGTSSPSCENGNCLRLVVTDGAHHTVKSKRSANLKGAKTATLKFKYRALFHNINNSKDTVDGKGNVWVKGNYNKDKTYDNWTMVHSLDIVRANLSSTKNDDFHYQSISIPYDFLTEYFQVQFMIEGHEWYDLLINDIHIDVTTDAAATVEEKILPDVAPANAPKTSTSSSSTTSNSFRGIASGQTSSSTVWQRQDSRTTSMQQHRSLTTSTENFADNFDGDSTAFTGNDGTLNWSDNNWSPSVSGYNGMYLTSMSGWCLSGKCLRLLANENFNTQEYSDRGADLSGGVTSATLTFHSRAYLHSSGDAKVLISSNGGATYQTLKVLGTSAKTHTLTIPSSYYTSNFRLRFYVDGYDWNDLYIDNISLDITISNTSPTVAPVAAPVPTGTVVNNNYADDFDVNTGFTGNDGTLDWSDASWTGSGSGTGVYVMSMSNWCASSKCLRLLANKSYYRVVTSDRGADLSTATSASVTFYSKAALDSGDGSAKVYISNNDGQTYDLLTTIQDRNPQTVTYNLSSQYLTSQFRIRFYLAGTSWNDLYIDNISIDMTSSTVPPPPPTAAPVVPPTTAPIIAPTMTPTEVPTESPIDTPQPTNAPVEAPTSVVVPNNFADDFDVNTGFTGNDGSLDWSDSSWTGSSSSGVYVMSMSNWCASGDCLRLLANENYFSEVTTDRGADLSTATTASLTFYSKAALDSNVNDGVAKAYVSKDGGQTYDLLVNIQDRNPQTTTYTLSSQYYTSQFRIRFYVAGTSWNDLYIDNISLDINSPSTPTPPSPTPPTPTPPTPTPPTPTPPTPTPPTPTPPTPTGTFSPGCGSTNNGIVPGSHGFVTISSSNKNRQYYLSIPQNYNSNTNYDVIFGFHGVAWRGDWMSTYLKLNVTETYGDNAILVYPSALNRYWPMWTFDGSHWVEGWLTGQMDTNEDFIFFDDMLNDISNDICINPKRVFVTGQSWGGDMASALPCARGNQIAASVSVASNSPIFFNGYYNHYDIFPPLGSASNCDRPVPMMTMKGQYDPVVSGTGKVADWWYDINQCTTPVGSSLKDTINSLGEYVDIGCAEPNVFIQYSNSGTGKTDHSLPRKYPYLYNETALNFFDQHTLP